MPYNNMTGTLGQALIAGAGAYQMARQQQEEKAKAEAELARKQQIEDTKLKQQAETHASDQQAAQQGYKMAQLKAQQEEEKAHRAEIGKMVTEFSTAASFGDVAKANQAIQSRIPSVTYTGRDEEGDHVFQTKAQDGSINEVYLDHADIQAMAQDPRKFDELKFKEKAANTRQQAVEIRGQQVENQKTYQQSRLDQGATKLSMEAEKVKQGWAKIDALNKRSVSSGGGDNKLTAKMKNVEYAANMLVKQGMNPDEAKLQAWQQESGQIPKWKDLNTAERAYVRDAANYIKDMPQSPLKAELEARIQEGLSDSKSMRKQRQAGAPTAMPSRQPQPQQTQAANTGEGTVWKWQYRKNPDGTFNMQDRVKVRIQ